MKPKKIFALLLSLITVFTMVFSMSSSVFAESFTLPKKMTDSKGNTLCTYQINGKTLNIQASAQGCLWPFSVSNDTLKQNMIISLDFLEISNADGIVELVLNPLVESGQISDVVIKGSYVDDYSHETYSLDDTYSFQRDGQGRVCNCKHGDDSFNIKYDSKGRLTQISGQESVGGADELQENKITFTYNSNGTLKETKVENWNELSMRKFRFNSSGQLTWQSHGSMHGSAQSHSYTYKNKRLSKVTTDYGTGKTFTDYTLTYDSQGRLSTVKVEDGINAKFIY